MDTLKSQINRALYSSTVMGTLGGLLHLVQRGGAWASGAPPSPLLAVPNVTAHLSTANVPTSYYLMWHYTECFKKVAPPQKKLFGIFSLWLNLFA